MGSIRKILRKFKSSEDGVTAIEFSFIALPFITMIIGIMELALMFSTQSLLDGAAGSAARLVRTGQIQQGGNPQDAFEQALCDFADALIRCEDIQYQVVSVDSFDDADQLPDAEFDEDGNLTDQSFDPGGVSDVVLIRAAHQYNIATPFFGAVAGTGGENTRTMLATIVLQTEPYEFEDN